LTVISGLATGIDTAAHGGALSAGGATLAVLGCGNAICYPRRNAALRDAIARHGAVVSEYAPDAAPLPYRFPRRNRIIAGLARGVVVVQADLKSGSLITARMALDENREVFAVPGAVQDPLSRGCHALIRDGARLVEGIEDIFDELPSLAQGAPRMDVETVPGRTAERGLSSVEDLSGDALKALACLDAVPLSVDELARLCGRSVAATAALLTRLELAGVAGRVPGEGYIRTSWSAGE
ncbi:MAG: DNA-protecting protein DprA, partial [Gammaproteobacteria bacterium]|nr:DNA-protecting protein DprA [Gammaproteobacteria bacterium]